MRLLRLITPLLCLAPASFAQLTPSQKVADFMQLAGLYAKHYGPYELRRDLFGFDLYNVQPWLDQVNRSTDDISFYDICVRYVASLHDSHDEFTLPTDFEAWLHMDVDIYDGKVLIGFIDRSYLSEIAYPFEVGDELVSLDGVAAADLVTAFIPYAVNGSGSVTSQMRLAAGSITDRVQSWMPRANAVGDTATAVIRRQDGTVETYAISWDKIGTPILKAGPVLTPRSLTASVSRPRKPLRRRVANAWGAWDGPRAPVQPDPVPYYMQPMMELQQMSALAPAAPLHAAGIFPFDSFTPIFDPPKGFKLRLGARSTDQFISGTFPVGTHLVGFIRISTMAPPSTTTALNQFFNEIQFMRANTDSLVIDIMGNGGGNGCYSQQLVSALIPHTFRGLAQQIRATLSWVESFSQALAAAKQQGAPQYVIDLYTSYLQAVQQALSENRGDTGELPMCSYTFDAAPLKDINGNILAYTKPILVLTDNFTLSAAEIFAMMMQDSNRATLFGTRTDGGGGNVLSYAATDYSEGSTRVTAGLITRAQPVATPGFPANIYYDGQGIYPDIVQDYQTLDNLLNYGQSFVAAFITAVSNMIQH